MDSLKIIIINLQALKRLLYYYLLLLSIFLWIDCFVSQEQETRWNHCGQQERDDGLHQVLHRSHFASGSLRPGERGAGLRHFQRLVQVTDARFPTLKSQTESVYWSTFIIDQLLSVVCFWIVTNLFANLSSAKAPVVQQVERSFFMLFHASRHANSIIACSREARRLPSG